MNNYAAIEKQLSSILPVAEKHAPDVLRVVTTECISCEGSGTGGEVYSTWSCRYCHGTGRVLRDWSDLPDGALAGAWENLFPAVVDVSYTDDLGATKGVLRYLEATYE